MSKLLIDTAEVFQPLLKPARYKGAWGGRGGGKSQFFVDLGIEDSIAAPGEMGEGLRIVCIREVQKSLKQSAKRLFESKLQKFGLGERDGFKIFNEVIKTPGDGVILFQGMQDHTAESVKSLDGVHRAWSEESQSLSSRSISLLRPTIRWEDKSRGLTSQLWFSWNPTSKRAPVDLLLRGENKPTDATVVRCNWNDNPWFPDVLEQERQDCLANNPEDYDHIWEGGYAKVLSGAYYAKHLADARREGRIGRVPRDPLLEVRAYWDIGGTGQRADATAIWLVQFVGKEIRWLDHYEAVGQEVGAHVAWLRARNIKHCVLPHDGATHDKVYAVTYEGALRSAGFTVTTVPNQGRGAALQRVEALRRVFPASWFNEATTENGIEALGWYHEKRDEARNMGLGPDHDWSSHSADAAGLVAIAHSMHNASRKTITFDTVKVY